VIDEALLADPGELGLQKFRVRFDRECADLHDVLHRVRDGDAARRFRNRCAATDRHVFNRASVGGDLFARLHGLFLFLNFDMKSGSLTDAGAVVCDGRGNSTFGGSPDAMTTFSTGASILTSYGTGAHARRGRV